MEDRRFVHAALKAWRKNGGGGMKLYEYKYMDNKIIGQEPGTDYDNAFMKTYDEAVAWLNS